MFVTEKRFKALEKFVTELSDALHVIRKDFESAKNIVSTSGVGFGHVPEPQRPLKKIQVEYLKGKACTVQVIGDHFVCNGRTSTVYIRHDQVAIFYHTVSIRYLEGK